VNLLDSLLDAIVRLDGDALVLHVGEKPYVVTTSSAMCEHRGPLLWGQVDLSSRVLTSEAVLGMLGQIMPLDQRQALEELGAVEHYLETERSNARFSVIAARAGDDVWLEVRKRPKAVPVAVAQPIVDEPAAAVESVVTPQETAIVEAPIEQPIQAVVEEVIAEPIEEPAYLHDTAHAVEQSPIAESPAVVDGEEIEDEIAFNAPALAIEVERKASEAPFEIVHEVNQDAPTDADVDELLAASAAALLRSAARAVAQDPLDIGAGAWLELEEQREPVAIEPEPESVVSAEPVVIAEAAQAVVPEPMALASQMESIAIAPELELLAIALKVEHVPVIAAVEPEPTMFVDARFDAEIAEPIVTMVPEPEPVLMKAEPEFEAVAFAEEFLSEEFLGEETAQALVRQPELVLVGAEAELEPVAFPDDFRLVAQTAEAFVAEPVAIQPEPEAVAVIAEAQRELFTFAEGFGSLRIDRLPSTTFGPEPSTTLGPRRVEVPVFPEPVAFVREPESLLVNAEPAFDPIAFVEDLPVEARVTETIAPERLEIAPDPDRVSAIAEPDIAPVPFAGAIEFVPELIDIAPEPEAAEIFAETEHEPVYIDPEPVALVFESEHVRDAPVPIATPRESDRLPVLVGHEQPVMASVPPREPDIPVERAVIVPLARRPVRQAATSSTTAHPELDFSIDELLRVAAARGASTVYLVAQSRPMVRAEGDINVLDIGVGRTLEESDIARLMLDLAPASAREAWQRGTSAEWMCDVADVGRVRCMTFRDHRGPGLIFRMIPPQAISADQLGLTHEVQALCAQSDGLVLVTGPRASGKSTLMSAFVDLINRTRSDHVITIESQIGFVHESRRSFVSQREERAGSDAVVSAVRSALREDPDVLFIGDLSTAEVAAVAVDAAESGRLVFASLPATSTVAAVDRLLELLPADRPHARASIAASLRGVVAQVLVRRTRGGRIAAREVLLNTAAVAGLIQEAKTGQLPLAMESGRRHGMMPLNDALTAFVREGIVHVTEAYRKAFDKESLLAALRREGVDTSFAEKLA